MGRESTDIINLTLRHCLNDLGVNSANVKLSLRWQMAPAISTTTWQGMLLRVHLGGKVMAVQGNIAKSFLDGFMIKAQETLK